MASTPDGAKRRAASAMNREGSVVPSDDDIGDPADALVPVIPNRFAPQLASSIAVPDLRHIGRDQDPLCAAKREYL
jgi:hypothetical protein